MSYDIRLTDADGETLYADAPLDLRGGTYAVGGTKEAWLNVTYNYSGHFRQTIDADKGIRFLYGKKASECIPILEKAIATLGTEQDEDYWKPTPGNAGAALNNLLALAKAFPDGIFAGD